MSELENAIKTLTKTADKKELPYIIADIIKKNCDSSTINLLSQYLNETKPNEALKGLEHICEILNDKHIDIKWLFKEDYNTIKQTLLKAQELEKEFDENKKSDITSLSFTEFKEIHKNDTPVIALDILHRLSLVPDYIKPNSVEVWARRFLRDKVEQALTELEQIEEAKPSKAMECLENIEADLTGLPKHVTEFDEGFDNYLEDIWSNISTIKQTLLKAKQNARSEETLQKYYQEGITLDSVRALKQERDNYKKALAVVWRKPTQIRAAVAYFRSTLNPNYEDYCTVIMSEDQLTKEEFETFREIE